MDDKPTRQAHPMMATPQPPTRITVSTGPKAEPHLAQQSLAKHTHTLAEFVVVLGALILLVVLVLAVVLGVVPA
jgi:hypothetical protein